MRVPPVVGRTSGTVQASKQKHTNAVTPSTIGAVLRTVYDSGTNIDNEILLVRYVGPSGVLKSNGALQERFMIPSYGYVICNSIIYVLREDARDNELFEVMI